MKRFDRSIRGRPKGDRPPRPTSVIGEASLVVDEMGARGDALAPGETGPIYVPYALPGERVRARVAGDRGELLAVEAASAERVAPPCRHFGRCGGCQLQHWADAPMIAWKRAQVVKAMERRGVETPVEACVVAWGAGRRRAAFHAMRGPKGVRFGFLVRGAGGLVEIAECPVLDPRMAAALPALRALAAHFAPERGELVMPTLLTDEGLDVDLVGARLDEGPAALEAAAAAAEAGDFARLSLDGAPLITRRTPSVRMGLARVAPPPGAFFQPTAEGEARLAALALEAIGPSTRVADLFSGVGTFALRLAETAEVHAVEGEQTMLDALKKAADGAAGALKAVTIERRDLLRAPVSALELKRFDGVVFDPPRSGARLQAEQIGASKASRVAAVSCDPATFARDARVLIDSGFRLTRVTPVDQFRWTPHIEIVGAFAR